MNNNMEAYDLEYNTDNRPNPVSKKRKLKLTKLSAFSFTS